MRTVRLEAAHIPEVAALEALCFHAPWGEKALELLCRDNAFGFVCLDDDGKVLAYAGVLTVLDEGQITNVATHPRHRRRGCGDAILTALIAESRARGLTLLSLEVRESNEAAIGLYQKWGFVSAGRRPNFYHHPTEAALVMLCSLSG